MVAICLFLIMVSIVSGPAYAAEPPLRLVIHGGAGAIKPEKLRPAVRAEYTRVLAQALQTGYARLRAGGSSMDAVTEAIVVMEDSPLFNAGRGAVFSHEGRNELDASLMEGRTLMAGAVAGVTTIRNPIRAAGAVMTRSPHVLLAGRGAERFAREHGLEIVDPAYFRIEARWKQLQRAIDAQRVILDHDADPPDASDDADAHGTVGAVALDGHGNLAAGTSTGGLTNKRWGRVGDSALIGAGTYADNGAVAVSATGVGETFIRTAAAFNVAARVRLNGTALAAAADAVLAEIAAIGGDGGLIVVDAAGNYAMRFNTRGMYRGTIGSDGVARVAILGEPETPVDAPD